VDTIAAIATKGGAGKTSLIFALGIEAAKTKSVFFCDLDPQASLTRLCERRDKAPGIDKNNPMLLEGVGNIQEAIAKLVRTGYARDLLFLDTPGSMMSIITAAVGVADCVILPVQSSILDMEAQQDAAGVVIKAQKADRLLTVLNRVDGRTSVDDAVNYAVKHFGHTPLKINQRIWHSRALIAGRSGAEMDKECAREISALWAAVQQILEEKGHGENAHGRSRAVSQPARTG
jgi:cellulose biosynthesis protein BcsQ